MDHCFSEDIIRSNYLWAQNEPSGDPHRLCISLMGERPVWRTRDCLRKLPFVCQYGRQRRFWTGLLIVYFKMKRVRTFSCLFFFTEYFPDSTSNITQSSSSGLSIFLFENRRWLIIVSACVVVSACVGVLLLIGYHQ